MVWKLKCFDIDYCVEEEDVIDSVDVRPQYTTSWYDAIEEKIEEIKADLPKEVIIIVEADEDDLEDVAVEELSDKTGWLINSFDYTILDAYSTDDDFNEDEEEDDFDEEEDDDEKQLGYFDIEVEILEKDGVKMVYVANDGSSGVKYTLNDTDTKEQLKRILHDYIDDLVDYELENN